MSPEPPATDPGAALPTEPPADGQPTLSPAPGVAYPPNAQYLYPPYSYPLFPGQPGSAPVPPYSPYPTPYGFAPPLGMYTPPVASNVWAFSRRRRAWPLILAIVGAVVVIALVVGGLAALVNVATQWSKLPAAVATPVSLVGYTTPSPGRCDPQHPEYWQNFDNTRTSCAHGALVQTNPGESPTLSEVAFRPRGMIFPERYAVSAIVSGLTHACAGLHVLRQNYRGYGLHVCADGSWQWIIYSVSGLATTLNTGSVPVATSYRLEVIILSDQATLLINGKSQLSTTDLATYNITDSVSLAVEQVTFSLDATADFTNFSYNEV